jgi:DNA mismatch repair protein MutL
VKASKIELLPEHLIDQIKAGEVVERPANVLKELIENSIDAGSKKIEIEIQDNGLSLIRISDDGHGILASEVEKAFGRHATSKIKSFQDLYRLHSFGFRGEALAAISSISQVECASWTENDEKGTLIKLESGIALEKFSIDKTDRIHGSVFSVKNIFYNTPVRVKFLQGKQSEKNWIKKYLYNFIINFPNIEFKVSWDQEEKYIYPSVQDVPSRILQFFSEKNKKNIHIISHEKNWNGIKCQTYIIQTHNCRSDGPLTHLCINGRAIVDKALQRICSQTLENMNIHPLPDFLVKLDLPPDTIDVNIHPNKTSVKIFQVQDIYSLVSSCLKESLKPKDFTPDINVIENINSFERNSLIDLPKDELGRDSKEVYQKHLYASQDIQDQDSELIKIIHHHHGPYFLVKRHDDLFYIDGKKLLKHFIHAPHPNAGSYPLLVSFPIRDHVSDAQITMLKNLNFEIDFLNNLPLIREIPLWAKSIPLSILLSLIFDENLENPLTFDLFEISHELWLKLMHDLSFEKKSDFFIKISPALF